MRPMRRIALLLAIVLAMPAGVAWIRFSPLEHWEAPPGAAPQLTPPNPAAGSWPPYLRRSATAPLPTPTQTTGVAKIVVLLIDFTDVREASGHDPAYFDARMNAGSPTHSVRSYYQEISRGALTLNATIIPTWFHSTHPMSYYGADSASGVDDANGPIYRLVTEAVRLADPTVDFSQFDTNGDGVVDHVMVVHAGGGQESDPTNKDLIWSHRWAVLDADPSVPGSQPLTADGVQIYGYTMESEDFVIGTVAHEFGHDLGLPDLYDTDGSSNGAGIWDIMSLGSWTGSPAGSSPAHMSAWSLIRLGWVTPTEVTSSLVGTSIDAVENSGKVFRLSIPGTTQEYFLIENRQPIGFDAALPGSGLLIWHVDDSQTSNDQDTHRLLDLEEMDEGVSGDHPIDSGDPWHDTATGWGPETAPDSRAYDGSVTSWRVRDISASGATMIATIARDVTKDLAVSAIRLPFTQAVNAVVRTEVDVRNEGLALTTAALQVDVYREMLQPAARVTGATFNLSVASQTTVTSFLNFTPTSSGRYIVRAVLVGANDEIPSNDERVAHVLVNTFRFRDDVESGPGSWSANGVSSDLHQWRIVNESDVDGSAHSRTHSWRFGYVASLLPNPFPAAWYTLTSTTISVSPGPTFLILYQRHDLTGRTVEVLPIGSNNTDEAFVEVSYAGGPWVKLVRYTGVDLTWRVASFDLTANSSGSMTLQVRFNVSANVIGKAGGWWIDDVMIAALSPARAGMLLGSMGPLDAVAGGSVRFALKLANVGEYDTDFRLDAVLPAGWDATLEGGTGGPLRGQVVRLAPDNDAALRIVLSVAGNATAGSTYPATISATAVGDPTVKTSTTVQVRISSGLPQDLIVAAILVASAIVIAMLVVVLVRRRRRRPLP
jgi:M6 family metalloprotease-like protein